MKKGLGVSHGAQELGGKGLGTGLGASWLPRVGWEGFWES